MFTKRTKDQRQKEHALTKQNGTKWCGEWWLVGEDGVPDHGQEEATVQVHVRGGFPDLDGFYSSTDLVSTEIAPKSEEEPKGSG